MLRRYCKRVVNRLSSEVERDRGSTRIAPPGLADQMLAGTCEADQAFEVLWIESQRGEEPTLRLGRDLGSHLTLEEACGLGKTLIDADFDPGIHKSATAGFAQQQCMDLPRDLARDPRLNTTEFVRVEFIAAGPAVFRRRRIGNLNIDSQGLRTIALGAAGNNVLDLGAHATWRGIRCPPLISDARQRQSRASSHEIGDEIFGERLHQVLLLRVAGQVAQRCHRDRNARQQTRPLQPGALRC